MHFLGKALPGVISSFAHQYLPKVIGWAGKKLSNMGGFANQVVSNFQSDAKLGQRMISSWNKARGKQSSPNQVSLNQQQHQQKQSKRSSYLDRPPQSRTVRRSMDQQQWQDQGALSQQQQSQFVKSYKPKVSKKRKPILKNRKRVSFRQ